MITGTKVITGLKLIGWQKDFTHKFLSLNPSDVLVVKASRQKGKSTMLCQSLFYVAINRPGSLSYFISPTNNQCRKQYNDMKDSCVGSPLVVKLNESTQEIHFANGSKVFFRSAESGDNLRGNTVNKGGILVIDEAAFIKDDTISILLPYVNVSKANIIVVSTPRRKSGMFYDWWIKSINNTKGFIGLDVNQYDNSFFISDEQILSYKSTMSPEKFKNEILGLFSELDEGVFGDFTDCICDPSDKDPIYMGIDWSANGEDETVISAFNKDYKQCFLWSDKSLDPLNRCKKIAELINKFSSLKKIVVEQNSIGSVYSALLKSFIKTPNIIHEFVTSNSSKREIIENMIKLLGEKKIGLLNDDKQNYQFSIYVQQPLKNGGYTYNADPLAQNSHDDYVMATALAIKGFSSKNGVYVFGSSNFLK